MDWFESGVDDSADGPAGLLVAWTVRRPPLLVVTDSRHMAVTVETKGLNLTARSINARQNGWSSIVWPDALLVTQRNLFRHLRLMLTRMDGASDLV
jgi:hypothetical protein